MADDAVAQIDIDLAEVATTLFAPGTVESTLQRIVDLAAATIEGCDEAGIFLVENERVITPASSSPIVVELDGMQFEADEGPCLDAVSERDVFYAEDLLDDDRWPTFGPAIAAVGFRSLLAYPLSAERLSALNLYAQLPRAFGAIDRAKALIFATLAGLALTAAEDRAREDDRADHLHEALRTRELIGQAQGILMERERITAEQAFDVLSRASQHMNVKLREIAARLVETGEAPGVDNQGTG